MRIALILDTFNIGGAETMVFEIAKLLKHEKQEPVLLHFGSAYVEEFCNDEHIEQHVLPNYNYYKKTVRLPIFVLKSVVFIKHLKLDCIHAHMFGPIVAFAPIAYLAKILFIGTLHDVYMIEEAPQRIVLIKLALFFNAKLVTVSKPMKSFYENSLKCKSSEITYIPNCTAPSKSHKNRDQIRQSLNLNSDEVVVISVGRLVQLKRFDILIDAMANLQFDSEIQVPIKCLIVGEGPQKEYLLSKIRQNGLESKVELVGERNDVGELLIASDIFVLTSETEGMSKSILEALSAGLPVVATNVGGNKEQLSRYSKNLLKSRSDTSF